MTTPYEFQQAAALIKLARYLISQADDRGLTHGEKHFLMQSALFLMHKAQGFLDPALASVMDRHEVAELDPSDIPF